MTRLPVGLGASSLGDLAGADPRSGAAPGWLTLTSMMPDLRIQVSRVGPIVVPLPRYQTDGSAGMDLHAALLEAISLPPLGRARIPTGLVFAIPPRFEGQIR